MYSAPINVCFHITSLCNLNCKHCINRNRPDAECDLTAEELIKVIDQLGQAKVFQVSLFGGEPLCHPDFSLIVEHLNKYPIQLSLNTNATLIDRAMAKWLREHKIRDTVVSFDGSTPEIMDRTRGKGTFEKNIRGIEALIAEGLPVLLSTTLTKINHKDIRAMALLGRKLNAGKIRFNHVFFGGNAACFIKEVYLSPEEEKEAIEEVRALNEEFPGFIYPDSTYLQQRDKFKEMQDYKPSFDKLIVYPCGAARTKCGIRADGWVIPCEIIWEAKCGNLKVQSLTDIWQNSELMNEFRRPMELDLNQVPECKGCQYQYICFIGHRCNPYYYPGGVKDRSVYCYKSLKRKVVVDVAKG